MSTKVDDETQRRLRSGDVKGEPLEPEGEFPEGVAAQRPDGQRVFHDQRFMEVIRLRNRGKD